MKNKSKNHKSTNRFKFVTFADRVSTIDVRRSALYHLEHANIDSPEENETYFHNTLVRWKVLNLTTEYVNFTKKVDNIVTLPQLLHKKDEVINLLLENIEVGDTLNLQPLLELVVVLARDLQEDFYHYFPKVLDCLVKLLNTKDPEQLEWTLICLAFLFKYLRVYLKKDVSVVLKFVLPLLSDSTKWYVRNFAAESFAFVARDVKDKRKFLELLVKTVQNNKDAAVGCGHLLYEVIRGVGGQYHSCSSTFFPLYYSTLQDKNINQKVLFEILTQTFGDMFESIIPKFSDIFWTTIIDGVKLFFNVETVNNKQIWKLQEDNCGLEYILKLIGQSLEYSQGKFMTNPQPMITLLSHLINAELSENICEIISQIGVLIILCTHIQLPHENAVFLVRKLLSIPYPDIINKFVQEVVSCSSFDVIVFPHFIDSISSFNKGTIITLSKICLTKSPLCKNGSDLYSWVKYPIDLGTKMNNCNNFIISTLNKDMASILDSLDDCINGFICLPHIKHLNLADIKKVFKEVISNAINHLKNIDGHDIGSVRNILFLLAVVIESAIHTINFEHLDDVYQTDDLINVLKPYLSDHNFICSLRILDFIMTVHESEHALKYENLLKVHPIIEKNLMSPFHEIRLLTTHIYSLFEIVLPEEIIRSKAEHKKKNSQRQIESFKIFSLCYSAESLSLSVENYKEQLLKLSQTVFDSVQYKVVCNSIFKNFSLNFMLGLLNANFKLLWEPLQKHILTYANGMPAIEFWEIFHPCLIQAAENVRNGGITITDGEFYAGKQDFLCSNFKEYFVSADKPDFLTYRIHLWEILYQVPSLCEIKNKDITILFMEFMKIEFEMPQHINVCDESISKMIVDNEEFSNETEGDKSKIIPEDDDEDSSEKKAVNKSTYDALLAHLKIYSTIQNPKALHKEQLLKSIYLDFLMHKNPIIQSVALDCLMKYKNKHWLPYKDKLYNLVDGKKFKDELRTFKTESESEFISSEDREELMPILLRIAFSKMITNTGIDKKGGSQMRRSLVMRFISGCNENELLIFTDMAFKAFKDYINLDLEEMHEKLVISSLNSLTSLSPKLLLGSLNLVENMREQFIKPGETLLLPKLMKIIFCIGTYIKGILCDQDKLKPGYVSILKNIRNTCIQSIANFFNQFDQWEWKERELLYICDTFIWPIIEKLPVEGIHSPTALLKLFNVWSQHPKYHNLFSICSKHDNSKTPVPFILQLLLGNKVSHSVYDMCMQMIERLLTLECENNECIILSIDNSISVDNELVRKLDLKESLNIGTCTLLPHVSLIVTVLKDKLGNVNPKKLHKRDLTILARVTEIVYDSKSVDVLLKFSLPVLIQKISVSSNEEDFESSVEVLTKLLSKTTDPKNHFKTLIPLFSKVSTARARKHLCEALIVLANRCDIETAKSLTLIGEIITEMNASDPKWLDQPDFERRLNAYKRIYQIMDEDKLSVEFGSLIIHNCFYMISHSNDISLRSNATSCLQKIVPKLLIKFKDNEFFVQDTVFNLIKSSLKSDNETLKLESISLLGELVRECINVLPILTDLHPLSNKSNKEIDFFENLQHLQIHRKTRALLKFCNITKVSKKVPSSKTLTQIILPLASQYICSEKFADKSSLVEAAIDTVGVVCRLLPWRQYESILKYYLHKLHSSIDYQKQLIKVTSSILDAFHFDLSKASNVEEIMNNAMLPKEMREEKDDKAIKLVDSSQINEDLAEENEPIDADIIPYERIQKLSPSSAKRVIFVITAEILVQLNWNSSQVTDHESSHKTVRKGNSTQRETDDKLRIPMAYAIIKLLQKLPQPMLKNNILSILIKVSNFLKSPLVNVRIVARDILSKIMVTVGTNYFNTLLSHLITLLTRGTQVHVMISTVHTILEALQNMFLPKEMDNYIDNILKVCLNDLFGQASEEKEVVKLGIKAPEAKPSKKSYLTLRIIAQNISDSCIVNLLKPFKDIVETTHSKRIVIKIETCFQYMSLGLVNNENISIESSLIFLCGILSDSIPRLCNKPKIQEMDVDIYEERKPVKTDCFLIQPDPKGSKKMPKKKVARTSAQANAHVITEFGLNMLFVILQKDKINSAEYRSYLDPMIPFVIDALKSLQIKVATLALKSITSLWVKKINLPTLKNRIDDATMAIFDILHKYATSGLSKKDENFHLVSNSFKAITSLIRNVQYHNLDMNHMTTLLMYAEHDIHDFEKQATAFSLLRAILSAKYKLPEIKAIMKKVAEITVTNESPRAREEASQVMVLYLMNYPSSKEIKQHIQFYVSQLEYEIESGRISVIKIIQSMLENFVEETLITHSGFLFVSLGMRLTCEPSNNCQLLLATSIELLIKRVPLMKRNELFNLAMVLLSDSKPAHIEMASQLSTRFIMIEGDSFKTRLETILPKLSDKLYRNSTNVGQFVRVCTEAKNNNENYSEDEKDNSYIQVLKLLYIMGEKCPMLHLEKQYQNSLDEICINCQNLLAHDHEWVRLNAVKFLGQYLQNVKPQNILQSINEETPQRYFAHTIESLKSLTLDLCSQFIAGEVSKDIACSVCKNITFLLKAVNQFPNKNEKTDESSDENYINIDWIIKKVKSAINAEVAKSPSYTVVRSAIFDMINELTDLLDKNGLARVAIILMPCLLREMSKTDASFDHIKNKAISVGTVLDNKLGSEMYNEIVSRAQAKLIHKRKERKTRIAQNKINNPERAAKRKLVMQEKKKEYKKRKMDKMKGRIPNHRNYMKPTVAMEDD